LYSIGKTPHREHDISVPGRTPQRRVAECQLFSSISFQKHIAYVYHVIILQVDFAIWKNLPLEVFDSPAFPPFPNGMNPLTDPDRVKHLFGRARTT
jgi:hypothetical protein